MDRLLLVALVVGCWNAASFAVAPKVEPDHFAELVVKLNQSKVAFPASLKDVPLRSVKEQLEKQFEIKFVVREDLFNQSGESQDPIMERKFKLDSNLSGLPLETFLRVALPDIAATFLVRKHYIEITTWQAASANFDDPQAASYNRGEITLPASIRDTPLVSAVVKEQPIDDVLTQMADRYGFTVIFAIQAAQDSKTLVSARLMNVPFGTALEVLAINSGLKVVLRDNTFIVTTIEHKNQLNAKAAKATKK